MKLKELRCVEWTLEGTESARELVSADDVDYLVEAILRLHRDPGTNPHSGRPAARLLTLAIGTPRLGEGYWWTAPSLDDDGPRARLVTWEWERRFDALPADDPPDP